MMKMPTVLSGGKAGKFLEYLGHMKSIHKSQCLTDIIDCSIRLPKEKLGLTDTLLKNVTHRRHAKVLGKKPGKIRGLKMNHPG